MNYIKQLTHFFNKSTSDPNLTPTHMSLFMALFQTWNQSRFPKCIQIIRDDMMRLSKINSKATYHKAMAYLHTQRYINYKPSYNPLKGSQISFFPTEELVSSTAHEPVQNLTTRPLNEPYNKLYSTNIITDNISTTAREKKENRNQKLVRSESLAAEEAKEKSCAKKETSKAALSKAKTVENGGSMRPIKNKLFSNEKKIPPAANLVEEFFLSQKSTLQEANRFINHYTANGWLVGGKSPMIDWEASAKNWIANSTKFNNHAKSNKSTRAQQLHTTASKNYFEPL
ncbi:transcriptional regulator [Sphingobacterium faecale]|uniref:Transcriptional regulator n=1 Tax=Sphingobacterium faecale TaxID=2803775 RepID=A0ABS1R298_9SPHI|nr:transcriptional regulator [Sphingobacterium faecale]MBL1408827.1 transcriptional regulator [Sphingobacterium faecale]